MLSARFSFMGVGGRASGQVSLNGSSSPGLVERGA
jgi:hypothetical protein